MAEEIERKFLVVGDSWRDQVTRTADYRQGYLAINRDCAVRVRLEPGRATLNIKNAISDVRRSEFDYDIPMADAEQIFTELCLGRQLIKRRHFVEYQGHTWEIDEFGGASAGLIVAELELRTVDESFGRPDWVGEEVSGDPRYLNAYLAEHPYRSW
ncbi:MAG: CYTH domain-containing protein [Gammaproteobacteria bacterium]|nr:CYTH domain-containing protein [Gammaproteobacteria bacterium]